MVLKSLILQGFKSFPDRTEIKFLGGITAIVGPNGSGKSNISDAIRWVLGEQSSRSLRGAKMEDVIFGGTAKRGPVGFAEVSLILDNSAHVFRSEFTEIMVTRRYYRSGESEYFLNKKHCRLKDVHELFMDTGLGRDGYSSIGQGRIDEILSFKSEDRREIFEEAAGITKFRYRKEEAERRLSATEENLVRIRDLYGELENRLEPLEQQADKAKRFLHLRDELRVLEVSLWLLSLEQLKNDTAKLNKDRTTCEKQLADAKQQQGTLYAQSEQLAESLREIDRETERLRNELREAEQFAAEQISREAVIQANIGNCEENIERTRQESAHRAEQVQSMDAQLAERRERISVLNEQEKAQSAELDRTPKTVCRAGAAAHTGRAGTSAGRAGAAQAGAHAARARTRPNSRRERSGGHERPQNDAGFRNRSSGTAAGYRKAGTGQSRAGTDRVRANACRNGKAGADGRRSGGDLPPKGRAGAERPASSAVLAE